MIINPFQSNFSANRILPSSYIPAIFLQAKPRDIQRTITCSHQNTWPAEKQKEYNLRYLLAKVRTTRGKASDRLRQRSWRNENVSDIFRHRSGTGKS